MIFPVSMKTKTTLEAHVSLREGDATEIASSPLTKGSSAATPRKPSRGEEVSRAAFPVAWLLGKNAHF